jgi:hypothetical protein
MPSNLPLERIVIPAIKTIHSYAPYDIEIFYQFQLRERLDGCDDDFERYALEAAIIESCERTRRIDDLFHHPKHEMDYILSFMEGMEILFPASFLPRDHPGWKFMVHHG